MSIKLPAMVISEMASASFAILDADTGCTARIVAGNTVNPMPDKIGDIDAILDACNQFLLSMVALFQAQVGRGRIGVGTGACRPPVGLHAQLGSSCAIQNPLVQIAVFHQCQRLTIHAFAIERPRAQTSR